MALLCVGVGISPTSWGVNGLQGRGSSHDLLSGAESPKEWSGGHVTLKVDVGDHCSATWCIVIFKLTKLFVATLGTLLEGTVSQIFYVRLSLNFMTKNGKLFAFF